VAARSAKAFVGRERELDVLRTALDGGRGRGSLWLLVGELGVGKTSLAERLCDEAGGAGLLTVRPSALLAAISTGAGNPFSSTRSVRAPAADGGLESGRRTRTGVSADRVREAPGRRPAPLETPAARC
jgi:AAA ATPase domain